MDKRSQVALEFLATYSWAFLVILIMIGSLYYFGILDYAGLLPDRCNFGTEIFCRDQKLGTNSVDLRLKNNVGEGIIIPNVQTTGFEISSEKGSLGCNLQTIDGAAPGADFIWGSGEISDFHFDGCDMAGAGFIQGNKEKVLVVVTFYSSKSTPVYTHQVFGDIFSSII